MIGSGNRWQLNDGTYNSRIVNATPPCSSKVPLEDDLPMVGTGKWPES